MDWKRERDGLVVVVAVVVVLGLLLTAESVARFTATLVATFLGVLLALRVDSLLRGGTTDAATPVPAPEPRSTTDRGPAAVESDGPVTDRAATKTDEEGEGTDDDTDGVDGADDGRD